VRSGGSEGEKAAARYDEFLVLRFRATNVEPYPFEWVSVANTEQHYGAMLVRLLREYESRF
jgi:hypothetical protein